MTKEEARREARARLKRLPPGHGAEVIHRLERHLWSVPEVADAGTILLYAAMPREVPTQQIARAARARGAEVVYPRCLDGGELSLHRVEQPDQLVAGGLYGLLEPGAGCAVVRPEQIDVALIPGLAWSRSGQRLGRGAGYFDRLLASPGWRGFRCGIFFAVQEMDDLPHDSWDVPLDAVVTEAGVVRTGARSGTDSP